MKKLILSLIVVTIPIVSFAQTQTVNIDVAKSKVSWEGAKVTGSNHVGVINIKKGAIEVNKGKIVGGLVTIDMGSLKATDSGGAKLTGHLKSEDFFHVDRHPTSEFKISSVKGKTVKGRLTVKGVHADLVFQADKVEVSDKAIHVVAKGIEVDRTKYGVKYGSSKFFKGLGDKAIKDIFLIDIDIKSGK